MKQIQGNALDYIRELLKDEKAELERSKGKDSDSISYINEKIFAYTILSEAGSIILCEAFLSLKTCPFFLDHVKPKTLLDILEYMKKNGYWPMSS